MLLLAPVGLSGLIAAGFVAYSIMPESKADGNQLVPKPNTQMAPWVTSSKDGNSADETAKVSSQNTKTLTVGGPANN